MSETPPATLASGSPTAPRRRRLAPWIALGVVGILAAGAGAAGYYGWCQGASGERRPLTFRVPQGAAGGELVGGLHRRGVIRCGLVSEWIVRSRGLGGDLVAGSHDLTTNMTVEEAFASLAESPPPVETVTTTIPEGYRLTQIAERVARDLGVPANRFLSIAQSGEYALEPYLPEGTGSLEGFLFPKTYEFVVDRASPNDVIETLLLQFDEEVADLPWDRAQQLGISPYEVVIVASMIEREAVLPRERPLVSAVIYNRLRERMTLGIDATLHYVDPDPSDGLTESDLAMDSPYNTRRYRGLPPTPIASPGLESIRAALEPAPVDFLFYVLCGEDGGHEFTASYGEFLDDKARCQG